MRYPIHITFDYVFPDVIPVVSPAMRLRKVADRDLRPRVYYIFFYILFSAFFLCGYVGDYSVPAWCNRVYRAVNVTYRW